MTASDAPVLQAPSRASAAPCLPHVIPPVHLLAPPRAALHPLTNPHIPSRALMSPDRCYRRLSWSVPHSLHSQRGRRRRRGRGRGRRRRQPHTRRRSAALSPPLSAPAPLSRPAPLAPPAPLSPPTNPSPPPHTPRPTHRVAPRVCTANARPRTALRCRAQRRRARHMAAGQAQVRVPRCGPPGRLPSNASTTMRTRAGAACGPSRCTWARRARRRGTRRA